VYPWRIRILCLTALALAPLPGLSDEPPKKDPKTPPAVTATESEGVITVPPEAQSKDPVVKVSGVTGNKLTLEKGEISNRIVLEWKGDDFKYYYPSSIRVIEQRNDKEKKVYLNLVGYKDARAELLAVAAAAVDGKGKLSDIVRIDVYVGSGKPTDEPEKGGKTEPVLAADKLLVFIIEESSKPFENRLDVIDAVKKWAKDNGHWVGVIDKDVVNRTGGVPKYAADPFRRAQGKNLPQVVIYANQGEVGKFAAMEALPTDPEAAVKLVTKYAKR
jgi:hypothetical protein